MEAIVIIIVCFAVGFLAGFIYGLLFKNRELLAEKRKWQETLYKRVVERIEGSEADLDEQERQMKEIAEYFGQCTV